AIHREPVAWTAEIAIPRNALTGGHITAGNAWAANVIRVVPGKGVQALSLPAEAPEVALRPEGLGLLLFVQENTRQGSKTEREGRRPREGTSVALAAFSESCPNPSGQPESARPDAEL